MTNDEFLEALRMQRAVIYSLRDELRNAENALLRKGYRKDCTIPACNCGPQWNHGGHAEGRLKEISDALPYANGQTLLERVTSAVSDSRFLEALRACGVDNWEGYSDACAMQEET